MYIYNDSVISLHVSVHIEVNEGKGSLVREEVENAFQMHCQDCKTWAGVVVQLWSACLARVGQWIRSSEPHKNK